MTERDLVEAIRKSKNPQEWIVVPQVRSATGAVYARTADCLALNAWPSRGLELEGFEIKLYRGDWLRELMNPAKAERVFQYCDRWSVVVPKLDKPIVRPDELPRPWGLIEVDAELRLHVTRDAAKLKPLAFDRKFVAAVLRALDREVGQAALIAAARLEGYEHGKKDGEKLMRYRLDNAESRNEVTWKRQALEGLERSAEVILKGIREQIRDMRATLDAIEPRTPPAAVVIVEEDDDESAESVRV